MYNSETWKVVILEAFQMWCCRRMLKINNLSLTNLYLSPIIGLSE